MGVDAVTTDLVFDGNIPASELAGLFEEIQHNGVKGMHWGVHRSDKSGSTKATTSTKLPQHSSYKDVNKQTDVKNYGSAGSDRINKSLHEGATLREARKREDNIHTEVNNRLGKDLLSGLAAGTAGYIGMNVGLQAARNAAWSPKTLKVVSGIAQKAPFGGKVVLANGLIAARVVTAVAASPQNRYIAKWVAASAGSRIGIRLSKQQSLKKAVKNDAAKNG